MALQFILIQNRQGKTRLARFFSAYTKQEESGIKSEIHRIVSTRDGRHQSNFADFRGKKIVYRRYAGLYFCVCVDNYDNELVYLEAIHNFVEILDDYFDNVCELDLVFNFYKVYAVLDELFIAGEIEETSKANTLARVQRLDMLE
ncbi:hypothetical protein CANCADRAFT_117913 [Tortispora caseinolytica NRRL Y-17796]|uniref:AP complex subunit sigma n=1 Tax=Tortispora caseinolytica NRRL Y-17796 TaxID=767744 RepID=A0A1E4THK0_9ASCO|nr:hypothetical protein CANCADRAFT_117913 [Tortispora caseinolytica NRRL Y-17796]